MRALWALVILLLAAAGAAVFWWPAALPAPEPQPALPTPNPAPQPPPTAPPPAAPLLAGPAVAPSATPALQAGPPATIEHLDEHTVRLDGRYTVRGSGTEQDPFAITWDLLASAKGPINAEQNHYELPGRLAPLQGAWVQISGFWAPPLQRFETKDIMFMMNKWDGCCIGVPPTPFDSVEVQLAAPVAVTGMHVFRYGTIRGRLQIEPFAAGGFLLGLYRLTDATLESS